MRKGEDYPLKTHIMERVVWVFYGIWQRMFLMWVLIFFFFFFSFDLGSWLLLEAKSCFWAGEVPP
jgi:hypothetical protein